MTTVNRYSLQFDHEKTVLKYFLLGKGYFEAIKALGYIEQTNERLPPEKRYRKDKVTPNLHHQIRVALSIIQLNGVMDEELCIICALLHDVQEDLHISKSEIEELFGRKVAEIVWRLTKKYINIVKNKEAYIHDMSECQVTSLVKGVDRLDNLSTMIGVFSLEKQLEYAEEAEKLFLPMIKKASKYFPSQIHAYTQISLTMKRQIEITRKYVSVAQAKCNLETRVDQLLADRRENSNRQLTLESEVRALTLELKQYKDQGVQPALRKIAANISQEEKAVILKRIADALNLPVNDNGKRLNITDIVELAALVSQVLGITTLELQNFDSIDPNDIIFIDVGNMPPQRVKAYLESIKNEMKQKRIPNESGGTDKIDSVYNPMSMIELKPLMTI